MILLKFKYPRLIIIRGADIANDSNNEISKIEDAYRLLPPLLSALPAKYKAPISLLLHSLSAGVIASELARIAEMDSTVADMVFYLALTHDIHQKLIEDGLLTLKAAKEYLHEKLDEMGKSDYYRYIEDAIELDACGKNIPIRDLKPEVSLICHIADMTQGSLEGVALLYWLKEHVKKLSPDLTVRFYSVMTPQIIARSYIMKRIYTKYIAEQHVDHLALASPWGLYVITREDELPEVIEASWDDLRIKEGTEPVEYKAIVASEAKVKKDPKASGVSINKITLSGDELREGLWSRFARMFYNRESLYIDAEKKQRDTPIYPVLPEGVKSLFVNIEFTDVEYGNIGEEGIHKCCLCGLSHLQEHSININMFKKIAGVNVTAEKWNRFVKTTSEVRGKEQWSSGVGVCPLCILEAVAIRESKFAGEITGVLSVSVSKPIPVTLLEYFGRVLVESNHLDSPIVGGGSPERVVLDYSSATIGVQEVVEPKIESLFKRGSDSGNEVAGVFTRIGKLISWGIYPVKFLPALDTAIIDRPVVTPYNFPILDFPVTSKKYGKLLPWIASLLKTVGEKERSEGLKYLDFRPEHAPLALLTMNKPAYDEVVKTLSRVGV